MPASAAYRILTVNPGSTSLKVALYENDTCLRQAELACDIDPGGTPACRCIQEEKITQLVLKILDEWDERSVDAVAARGGFLPRPLKKLAGGAYWVAEKRDGVIVVDETIVSSARRPEREHPGNFGVPVAAALARKLNAPAVVVVPIVVDEFVPEAELSGYKPITRRSSAHVLSVHAAARKAARECGRPLTDMNLVVAHLGGGITVAAVRGGKIIDSNIALLGDGPFTPRRAGGLPGGELIDLCYSGRFTRNELIEELTTRGGLISYLGTGNMETIERRITGGDQNARLAVDAMVYRIAKEIGGAFTAAGCDVEAIVLTGGLTHSKRICDDVRRRVVRLAPVIVYRGSLEMAALAAGAVDALSGSRQPLRYQPPEERETEEEPV
jgi:butyrate kinase